jgi:single-stranded-DNA-specific exonuclease
MQLQWNILQPDPDMVQQLQHQLNCHPVTAAMLANRNIHCATQAIQFLQPSLDSLPNPMQLSGMEAAVERICRAVKRQEKILVFGDYDADGITATAVMVNFLDSAGARVCFHLPHRVNEGYGLQPLHIMQLAVPQHTDLIITVDCGSSSCEAVAAARRFGIDVIVTDHHNIFDPLPAAEAIVNPKLPGQSSEFSVLAGVGVAFYLVIALRMRLRETGWWTTREEPNLKSYCDLVAIGTIADMVPMIGINRTLTRAGMAQINGCGTRIGIQAMLAASGIRQLPVSSNDIAFRLAPRINAAGRVMHPRIAYELLNVPDEAQARELANDLNVLNTRRQTIETQILKEITKRIDSYPDLLSRRALLLAGEGWHEGVLGIVAAKLVSRYCRPVVLIGTRDGIGKGSGRSIPALDLHAALSRCSHLLTKFGGHSQAAGMTVKTDHINELQKAFEEAVIQLTPESAPDPQMDIDSEIHFDQIDSRLLDEMQSLEPFGTANPAPIFMARDVCVIHATILGQRHRAMTLCQSLREGVQLPAIHFNLPPDMPRTDYFERLAFRLQWNRYKGNKQIQLVVEAF